MSTSQNALRAALARRIRIETPVDWNEFSTLWMAFNAIYKGEPDAGERARVIGSIRRYMSEPAALNLLQNVAQSIERILAIPPGNTQLEHDDPKFRAASQRYAVMYRRANETSISRLAAVGAVLYQIRCSLLHGSKDPQVERDRMLVQESLNVLRLLVPELEIACAAQLA